MASDSRSAPADAARWAAALDAIEAALDRLEPGARPEVVANALAKPIRAFGAVAKEACP